MFNKQNPQEPLLFNYQPCADLDDALVRSLDTLPREAMLAISLLHEEN